MGKKHANHTKTKYLGLSLLEKVSKKASPIVKINGRPQGQINFMHMVLFL